MRTNQPTVSPLSKIVRRLSRSRAPVHILMPGPVSDTADYPVPLRGPATHGLYEIAIGCSGRLLLVGARERLILGPGDIALIMPGTWHYETSVAPKQSYRACWLVVLGRQRRCSISECWKGKFKSHVLHGIVSGADCTGSFRGMARQARSRNKSGRATARRTVLELLREFDRRTRDISQPPGEIEQEPIRSLIRIMKVRFREPLQIRSLAAELGFTPNYLSYLFKKTFRTTFTNYLNIVRVWHAAFLLECGVSPKEAAAETGFRTVSYFTTVFKRKCRVSPGAYQKACLAGWKFPLVPRRPDQAELIAFANSNILNSIPSLRR